MLSLLVIVCPPLAALATETPTRAAGNLGLTLLGYFPGMLHAWGAVERYNIERRYDAVMRALERRAA